MSKTENPYKNLHIYYIQGHIGHQDGLFGDHFIGNWEEEDFSFLFFSKPSHDRVETLLNVQPDLILLDQFHMTYDEWQGGKLVPFKIGSFLVSPPWESDAGYKIGEDSEFEILLDPGVVFGTGTHPTTHDCLDILEKICRENAVRSVLDLGTGTGLLALASARLGCGHTLAVDFNLLAAKTARRNVIMNQLEERISVVRGRAEDFTDCPADLVVANIHYDVMKNLVCSEGFLRKKWIILSGLLRSEARDIEWKLSLLPVRILEKRERGGVWHTFLVMRET
ncbi:50S ribosomal protein L11 methyltransferase [Desulfococcaceae bacterium HSG8]|nr:50S ribosomal protein L11 methyltransferase [Desulfococcaceae bacterium HSG8]